MNNHVLIAFFISLFAITAGLPLVIIKNTKPFILVKISFSILTFALLWAGLLSLTYKENYIDLILMESYKGVWSRPIAAAYIGLFAFVVFLVVSIVRKITVKPQQKPNNAIKKDV